MHQDPPLDPMARRPALRASCHAAGCHRPVKACHISTSCELAYGVPGDSAQAPGLQTASGRVARGTPNTPRCHGCQGLTPLPAIRSLGGAVRRCADIGCDPTFEPFLKELKRSEVGTELPTTLPQFTAACDACQTFQGVPFLFPGSQAVVHCHAERRCRRQALADSPSTCASGNIIRFMFCRPVQTGSVALLGVRAIQDCRPLTPSGHFSRRSSAWRVFRAGGRETPMRL